MTQMSAGQVPGISASGQFRIASANRHYAGVSRSGDDCRWQASMTALRAWNQHIVLLQKMPARAGIIAGPPGTAGHIDAGLNGPGTLLTAGRYPSGRRALTSCSVI